MREGRGPALHSAKNKVWKQKALGSITVAPEVPTWETGNVGVNGESE